MSTIQQIKNFIRHGTFARCFRSSFPACCRACVCLEAGATRASRHDDIGFLSHHHFALNPLQRLPITRLTTELLPLGKQARGTNFNEEPPPRKNDSPPHAAQPVQRTNMPASDPALNNPPQGHAPLAAYSEAPGDGNADRAAQAGHAAAHHVEPGQNAQVKSSKHDQADLAKLIAEENATKSQFPRYPGLERWELLEKMGDGAFSNVYRARDTQGDLGEVGIKVVRKYEMNSMQVSLRRDSFTRGPSPSVPRCISGSFTNRGGLLPY